jgi:hypothetical protein
VGLSVALARGRRVFMGQLNRQFTSEPTLALVRRPDLLPWRVRRVPGKCCSVDVEPVGANGLPPDYPPLPNPVKRSFVRPKKGRPSALVINAPMRRASSLGC